MKYKIKELLEMNENDLAKICNFECETNKCPFKPSLRTLREDGFCIKDTYRCIDKWVKEDTREIVSLESEIKYLKQRIKQYKKYKNIINKELGKEEK